MNLPGADILAAFGLLTDLQQIEPWGSGHIHQSYRVTCRVGSYLMQRINRTVFRRPRLVMENIQRVTHHTRQRLQTEGADEASLQRQTLTLVPTLQGRAWHRAANGDWWRLYHFIPGAVSLETVSSPEILYKAGQVIGRFQSLLSDMPGPPLHAVIPHFHNTPRRLAALWRAQRRDASGRAGEVRAELAHAAQFVEKAATVTRLLDLGRIPWRVTHNDTKLGNILFDETSGEGLCLVDLDTVMPGSALYDFGDAARSGVSTAPEDEPDPKNMSVDRESYSALLAGYLSSASAFLTPLERDLLPLAPWLLAFEQGVRFLTDHLNGDIYYKIAYPGHNRVRARAQLALADSFLAQNEPGQTF